MNSNKYFHYPEVDLQDTIDGVIERKQKFAPEENFLLWQQIIESASKSSHLNA